MAAARTAVPRCGPVRVVALDGRAGSGKSTLAGPVAEALGCPVLRVDLLYPGWDGLAAGVQLLHDRVLAPLSRGTSPRFHAWDWATDAWGPEHTVAPTPYLVVEGCGSSTGDAGTLAAVRVWLEVPAAVRKQRALARDGETFAPWWDRWAAQEDALFAADRTRERADLVLPG